MNTRHLPVLLTALAALCLSSPRLFAQGALIPSGPPGPTMKTLDQVEARTPLGTPGQVTTSTITISQPGSYVLMGPITVAAGNGITITANNVTLDLNGFTISSTNSSDTSSGVYLDRDEVINIKIHNGFISGAYRVNNTGVGSGSGFNYGVRVKTKGINISLANIAACGIRDTGIYASFLQSLTTVTTCQVSHAGKAGIYAAIIENCQVFEIAADSGNNGAISGTNVRECRAFAPFCNVGITAETVSDSIGYGQLIGISATTVSNSSGAGDIGISAKTVSNSSGTGGYGISATMVTNSFGIGVRRPSTNNIIGILSDGTVSFSRGSAPSELDRQNRSIQASIAIGCSTTPGILNPPIEAPQKHLGTP